MTPVPSRPLPGSMTVPPWFGWEAVLVVLVLLVAVAVAFFVVSAAGADVDGRSEWQAELDARSRWRADAAAGPGSGGDLREKRPVVDAERVEPAVDGGPTDAEQTQRLRPAALALTGRSDDLGPLGRRDRGQ